MNRATLRALVSNFVEDPNLTRYTPAQYNEALNLAAQEFAFDSKALFKDASTYTVVAGTATYSLPSDFWLEKMVTHKGLKLEPISRHSLLLGNDDDWTDDVGTPSNFLIDPEEARKQLRLYPIPEANDAGDNLVLTYYPIPADMGSDTDSPLNASSLMAQFHMGIAAYAAWLLLGYGEITQAILIKRNGLLKQYSDKVTMAIDTFGNTKSEPYRLKGING